MKQLQETKSALSPAKAFAALAMAFVLALGLSIGAAGALDAQQAFAADSSLTTSSLAVSFNPKISKKSAKVVYGKTLKLKVTGTAGKTVKWSSSNKKVAKISSKGKVTPVAAGKATIKAKVGSKTLSCKVRVVGKLNATKISMNGFQTKQLTLKGATAKKWTSSDAAIAVSSNGKISLGDMILSTKKATVTCTDTKGNKYTCTVTMKLPNISCEMDKSQYRDLGSTRYYFKHFKLENRSGKTISLENDVMLYSPFGLDSDTQETMLGMSDALNAINLSDEALVVKSGYWDEFWGFEGTSNYSIYSDGVFTIFVTVGSQDYFCGFSTDGTLRACNRS